MRFIILIAVLAALVLTSGCITLAFGPEDLFSSVSDWQKNAVVEVNSLAPNYAANGAISTFTDVRNRVIFAEYAGGTAPDIDNQNYYKYYNTMLRTDLDHYLPANESEPCSIFILRDRGFFVYGHYNTGDRAWQQQVVVYHFYWPEKTFVQKAVFVGGPPPHMTKGNTFGSAVTYPAIVTAIKQGMSLRAATPTPVATKKEKFQVTIHSVDRYVDKDFYQIYTPKPGFSYVVVNFSVKNIGEDLSPDGYTVTQCKILAPDGSLYDGAFYHSAQLGEDRMEFKTIKYGETVQGKMVFEVPQGFIGTNFSVMVE